MNRGTWIPGEGWIVFGMHTPVQLGEYVPVHDPREPVNSPYYVPPPPVVVEPVEPLVELTPGQRAGAFLVEQLTPDPVPSLTLQARAKAAGIAWRTIRNAQKAVGVKVFKDKSGPWMWSLSGADD